MGQADHSAIRQNCARAGAAVEFGHIKLTATTQHAGFYLLCSDLGGRFLSPVRGHFLRVQPVIVFPEVTFRQ